MPTESMRAYITIICQPLFVVRLTLNGRETTTGPYTSGREAIQVADAIRDTCMLADIEYMYTVE